MNFLIESPAGQLLPAVPHFYGFNFYHYYPSDMPMIGHAASPMPARATLAVMSEMLESKRCANRREFYIKSLRYYLTRFAETNPILTAVTTADVEALLAKYPVPSTRAGWLNRINTLFSFALKREYIEKNPCAKVERGTIEHRVPRILTPAEARVVYAACPQASRAWVVLCLWCGLRPSEAALINWEDINLERGTVTVRISKVRRFRIVTMTERANALLRPLVKPAGCVAPHATTLRRAVRQMRCALNLARWPQDIMRHTAASYHLALTGDASKVATSLGNSPQILLTHYNGVASLDDAKDFFKVTPPPPPPASKPNRKHEYAAIIAFHKKCKSYKKTQAHFSITSAGTLHYILKTRKVQQNPSSPKRTPAKTFGNVSE